MAAVRGFSRASKILTQVTHQRGIHTTAVAGASDLSPWNYIWKPSSSAPVTDKEKEITARKYGLLKEDYKPLKGSGEYPDLSEVPAWDRDASALWDYPEARLNYNEPGPYYHADRDKESRYHVGSYLDGFRATWAQKFLTVSILLTIIVLSELFIPHTAMPAMPKQQPYDKSGKKITNYSFD
ncbi:NADH dehydrogenase [ubiquinone] 1 beta subcomplex subunit 8, mitochondrial-like [Ylistrum balloti]|uniref:NADH dehydrogenase [ubiquinone] 1 beta subcomplex subunit 8, mitochondrial-like n=1 Tax=Ylistrum balloti TaxID=509963 RepID=UPI0029057F2C|nr:NADH dehydrogenase [ubiquinone] 1 beta subcomplex subunit 8, mitochondrial-like [Ylistrum balloti]